MTVLVEGCPLSVVSEGELRYRGGGERERRGRRERERERSIRLSCPKLKHSKHHIHNLNFRHSM